MLVKLVQADTWQEAVYLTGKADFDSVGWTPPDKEKAVAEYLERYPKICMLKSVLWERSRSTLDVSLVRPNLVGISTGYQHGESCPLSSTVVNVGIEHIELDPYAVYVP